MPSVCQNFFSSLFFPEYQRRVIHLLLDIRTSLHTLPGSTPSDIDISIQQLDSMEDAEAFENELAIPTFRKEMTEKFVHIAGISVKDMISKVLCSIMSKELMCKYNMYGQRGKVAFKNTRLCSVITDSVMKKFRDVSLTEIQKVIATKLRNAPKMK